MQHDGKILIGGGFQTISGVPRNGLARLNPDGTVDPAFNVNGNFAGGVYAIVVLADGKILVGGGFNSNGHVGLARLDAVTGIPDSFTANTNNVVYAIALQPDGKMLIGGAFTSIGGQPRNYIARLDSATGSVDSFNANAVNGSERTITAILIQRDGKILVGGAFHGIGGRNNNYVARLDPVTALADSFDPAANSVVQTITVQPDGKILVGGFFGSIGGQNRSSIARLDPVSGMADSFDPHSNGPVHAITLQPDGNILVGGGFFPVDGGSSIGGQARSLVARLNPMTGQADSFNPNPNMAVCCVAPKVHAIAMQPDGKVLLGGDFIGMAPNGGTQLSRSRFARIEKDGFADNTLDINAVGTYIDATAVQPDGKMVIAGLFSSILGVPRNNIARLNTDGSLDAAFNPNATGEIFALAVQTDGKILVGGRLTNVGGQLRNRIARLDPITGAPDSFNPNANGDVISIAVDEIGRILVGGQFNGANSIGGEARNRIARLDPKTGLADSFNPNASGSVFSIAVQPDGKILAGGFFHGVNSIGGQTRNYIARLDGTTGLADSFDPNPNNAVFDIGVQQDGKVLVVGSFSGSNSIGGQTRRYLARLDGVTGQADSFDPSPDDWPLSIALQADGKVLTNGYFSNIGGQSRNRIARLDPVSGAADSFDPNANALVLSTAVTADGKILVAGTFTNIGGQTRNLFARLTNDTPALQDLSATPTTITWSRGGAGPQLSRVTFEYSTDNLNYTSLGSGTYVANAWALSGLNLPNAQNFYIRARGYYHTGEYNGSESITETVRNVFLHEVSVASVVSRKVHGAAGAFDINLPRSGNPGIECRSAGENGEYQLVFTFANPITSVGDASVTSGTGSVASRMIDTDPHNYIVNLTGVNNAQILNIDLTNVNDNAGNSSSSVSVPMAILIGDVNGNGSVNGSDTAQAKTNSGAVVDGANFRSDINANGSINSSDISLAKANSGTALSSSAKAR